MESEAPTHLSSPKSIWWDQHAVQHEPDELLKCARAAKDGAACRAAVTVLLAACCGPADPSGAQTRASIDITPTDATRPSTNLPGGPSALLRTRPLLSLHVATAVLQREGDVLLLRSYSGVPRYVSPSSKPRTRRGPALACSVSAHACMWVVPRSSPRVA